MFLLITIVLICEGNDEITELEGAGDHAGEINALPKRGVQVKGVNIMQDLLLVTPFP